MNKSGSAGTLTDTYHQDAYGNVLSNVNTGAWASLPSFSGRHLTRIYSPLRTEHKYRLTRVYQGR